MKHSRPAGPLLPRKIQALAICCGLTLPASALQVRVFNAASHNRINNFPSAPALNPTFLNAGGNLENLPDLTGVGWNVQSYFQQLTLVSPRHFVGANHFRPAVGHVIRFLARDNTTHDFTIAALHPILNDDGSTSDVFLGELAAEVPASSGIRPLPYLNLATEAAYVGMDLIVLGQPARGGRGRIGQVSDFGGDPITSGTGITTRAFTFTYGPAGSVDDARAEVGDSGSPSFALRSGKAALVGTHTAVLTVAGTTTTYDTLVPHYAARLNTVMESHAFHLRKISPETTSFSASGMALTAVLALKPYTFRVTLTNGSAAADNVEISAAATLAGTGWVAPSPGLLRRGGMAAGQSSVIDLAFPQAPLSGTTQVQINVVSDGSGSQTLTFPLTVLPSYAGWVDGLANPAFDADDDGDGISNLLEYAFGGDNRSASAGVAGQPAISLLPTFGTSLRFLKRQDASARGIRQIVEVSESLDADSWSEIPDEDLVSVGSPVSGFALWELPAATGPHRRFFRVRVELDEP